MAVDRELLPGRSLAGTMDRRLAPLAVAVLAALAGCGAVGLLDGGTTPTPAARHVAAPGLGPSGVEDAGLLARAHRASLDGVSYTLRTAVVVRRTDGSTRAARRTTVWVARGRGDDRRFRLEQRATGDFPEALEPQVNFSAWSPGRHTYVRIDPSARQARYTRYGGGIADAIVVLDGDEAIDIYLAGVRNATVEETSVDGWLAYRLEATAPSGRHTVAVVDAFGQLVSLAVTLPASEVAWLHGRGTALRTVRYDRVGDTTVERPAWVDDAIVAVGADDETD